MGETVPNSIGRVKRSLGGPEISLGGAAAIATHRQLPLRHRHERLRVRAQDSGRQGGAVAFALGCAGSAGADSESDLFRSTRPTRPLPEIAARIDQFSIPFRKQRRATRA
jgi:hypothetical protein